MPEVRFEATTVLPYVSSKTAPLTSDRSVASTFVRVAEALNSVFSAETLTCGEADVASEIVNEYVASDLTVRLLSPVSLK